MFVELHEIYCQRVRIYTKLLCLFQFHLLNCQWIFALVVFPQVLALQRHTKYDGVTVLVHIYTSQHKIIQILTYRQTHPLTIALEQLFSTYRSRPKSGPPSYFYYVRKQSFYDTFIYFYFIKLLKSHIYYTGSYFLILHVYF